MLKALRQMLPARFLRGAALSEERIGPDSPWWGEHMARYRYAAPFLDDKIVHDFVVEKRRGVTIARHVLAPPRRVGPDALFAERGAAKKPRRQHLSQGFEHGRIQSNRGARLCACGSSPSKNEP